MLKIALLLDFDLDFSGVLQSSLDFLKYFLLSIFQKYLDF